MSSKKIIQTEETISLKVMLSNLKNLQSSSSLPPLLYPEVSIN